MTVRHGLVALLAERPMGVYELRKEFDARTGGTWPLNIGQVYTTLQRLVRDGVVEHVPEGYGERDVDPYRLTEAGYDEAEAWWLEPVARSSPGRDELVIKLALAAAAPDVAVADVVQSQRVESMRALRDYTRLKAREPERVATRDELAWSLVLDHLIFTAEAEVRWLDHVETTVVRAGELPVTAGAGRGAAQGAAPGSAVRSALEAEDATRTGGPR
ncbi:PadR family transcriptional regulator [Litorihabitans aurantiacus]|uniref:Transcriptional regulator n=1 Tax=Litorihabitans aurantiacus TaxID=1930061 RepID=A0AA38CQK2_9MICO|nr:PadR family transcriptional regulator [Litorihabitans aurantiacus]GMA32318.1 transcriptional regulator [Litorihabitans aurantiacus]